MIESLRLVSANAIGVIPRGKAPFRSSPSWWGARQRPGTSPQLPRLEVGREGFGPVLQRRTGYPMNYAWWQRGVVYQI